MELIQWMKSHLSHKFPKGAGYLEIFKRAMKYYKQREDLGLQKESRKSFVKACSKPTSRNIPKAVKQRVWKRDKGRCTFVGTNGKRCNSDYLVQFDHYPVPYARGGPSTVDNLRLLCARHNRLCAGHTYGKTTMARHYIKESSAFYRRSFRVPETIRCRNRIPPSAGLSPILQQQVSAAGNRPRPDCRSISAPAISASYRPGRKRRD